MSEYWPVYGLENTGRVLDLSLVFGNTAPVVLEIGFGNGDSLAAMAMAEPEKNFIGIEVHRPGVGHLLHLLVERQISNVRLMNSDAVAILQHCIAPAALDRVQLYFPDPWHKKRHHKRRIVQNPFINLVASRLRAGGLFHLATDWEDYAIHMSELMQQSDAFRSMAADGMSFIERPAFRPQTKFEQRGLGLGHGVWDLLYERKLMTSIR